MWLLGLALATAAPSVHDHSMDAHVSGHVAVDLEAGLIDYHDALFLQFQLAFQPDKVPSRYADDVDRGSGCLTGLVMELRDSWDGFSAHERDTITSRLTPWKADLVAPIALPTDPRTGGVLPPPANEPCFGSVGSNRVTSDHFIVEWDSGVSQSTAKDFLDSLEFAHEVLVDDLGWQQPDGMNDYKLLAYIDNANYGGAYTTVEWCGGGLNMPYIVTGKDAFRSDWYLAMASHEYHHAVQYSYGNGHEFWYWEATATYTEEYVYPSMNSWADYVGGYTASPHVAMSASNQQDQEIFWHMYGMAIWNFYLDQHVGGHQLVKDVWDYTNDHGRYYDVSQADALEGLGYNFEDLYRGFMATTAAFDYQDANRIPRLTVHQTVKDLPADGGSVFRSAPEPYGQNYIEFAMNPNKPKDLIVSFEGDDDGDWVVLLVGTHMGEVAHVQRLKTQQGVGDDRVVEYSAYDEMWMVVSPRNSRVKGYDYVWSASQEGATGNAEFSEKPDLADNSGGNGGDDGEPVDGQTAADIAGEDGEGSGCACTTVVPMGWWGILALPLVVARRRAR